jgi:hypothetical protein
VLAAAALHPVHRRCAFPKVLIIAMFIFHPAGVDSHYSAIIRRRVVQRFPQFAQAESERERGSRFYYKIMTSALLPCSVKINDFSTATREIII